MNQKGQTSTVILGIVALTSSILTTGGNWLMNRVLNSPDAALAEINTAKTSIAELKSSLSMLCNDYGQTVSRVDQNMQNIGKALKVEIVKGNANVDPCKIK